MDLLMEMQVSTASAGGCPADLDTISEELFKQLSSGQTVNVAGLLKSAAHSSNAGGLQSSTSSCLSKATSAALGCLVTCQKQGCKVALQCCF